VSTFVTARPCDWSFDMTASFDAASIVPLRFRPPLSRAVQSNRGMTAMLRSLAAFVMEISELLQRRLRNQQLAASRLRRAAEVVACLGAVQAQDFAAAKWALSLRANDACDAEIERAFADGEILRTHILRPTWHFVHRDDLRWMLALSAPRVEAINRRYYQAQELDANLLRRSRMVLERALAGGRSLTRAELATALERARIRADGLRLSFVVMHAELAGLICSGPRRGKQFTYMLLDERAGQGGAWARDQALAALTRRYFTSHGPATVRDFVWWSGLTTTDVRAGLAMNQSTLVRDEVNGVTCWHDGRSQGRAQPPPFVRLLANYDEYFIAFKERDWLSGWRRRPTSARAESIFAHQLLIDGRLCGTWARTLKPRAVNISVKPNRPITSAERAAITLESARYGRFLQLTPNVSIR
jgi:hypothetical protein